MAFFWHGWQYQDFYTAKGVKFIPGVVAESFEEDEDHLGEMGGTGVPAILVLDDEGLVELIHPQLDTDEDLLDHLTELLLLAWELLIDQLPLLEEDELDDV